jgi:hypothetical protein
MIFKYLISKVSSNRKKRSDFWLTCGTIYVVRELQWSSVWCNVTYTEFYLSFCLFISDW